MSTHLPGTDIYWGILRGKTKLLIAGFLITIANCFLSTIAIAQPTHWQWANSAGGSSSDYAKTITTDAFGNSYIAGNYESSAITFGASTLTNSNSAYSDILVVKYDAEGNVLWARSAGGSSEDAALSVTADDSGNCFVTGFFESPVISFGATILTNTNILKSDLFIVKYDAAGNVLWAKSAGGTDSEEGSSVAADASGNCYLAGSFESSAITFGTTTLTNPNPIFTDLFIVKYDSDGNVLWANSAGGSENDKGNSVAADVSGNCIVTGFFASPAINFGASLLTNTGAGSDMFIAKYDAAGNILWANSAGGIGIADARCAAVDAAGNSYVAGTFICPAINFGATTLTNTNTGEYDVYVVKYDTGGNAIWAKGAGGSNDDRANSVAADISGNCYATGSFQSPFITFGTTMLINANSGNDDIYIVKYDTDGNVLWARRAGGPSSDKAGSVAADASGDCLLTGYYESQEISFGSTTLMNTGTNTFDVFIAEISNWTGVESSLQAGEEALSICPNPSNGIFSTGWRPAVEAIHIYNQNGQNVYSRKIDSLHWLQHSASTLDGQSIEIDLSSQPNGIYLVSIFDGEKIFTGKVVIQ